jgi:hypothetical protein
VEISGFFRRQMRIDMPRLPGYNAGRMVSYRKEVAE